MRKIRSVLVVTGCAVLLTADAVYAQASGVGQPFDWRQLVGVLINTAGVMAVVQVVKMTRPTLSAKFGYLMPILAVAIGPLLMTIQGWLTVALGFPGFDFTPISAALTGTAAVAVHQVYDQAKNG